MASSDIPRSRRISREIRGIHGAEDVDGPGPLFSGPQGRSIVMSSRLALSLIAAFPQSWPDPLAETPAGSSELRFVHIISASSQIARSDCLPSCGHGQITPIVPASRCVVSRPLVSAVSARRTRAKFGRLLPAVRLQCFKRLNFLECAA
jgi:hypothetical protein